MSEKPLQVFQLRYVDSRVTPGDWAFSNGMTIGYFSSEARAQQALERAKTLPGFRDNIDGFFVTAFTIGATGFPSGFDPSADDAVVDAWLNE